MSEKLFSMASSPLTEMCVAICQPASDHFFLKTLPGCVHLQSVCTELLVMRSWKWCVWRTESHYPCQDTLRFQSSSSSILVCIFTSIFEKQPVPGFYINWFQFRINTQLKTLKIMAIFSLAAEPQNKEIIAQSWSKSENYCIFL